MSDFLASLNTTKANEESAAWEAEVTKAGETEAPPAPAPAPASAPEPEKPAETVSHETPPAPVVTEPSSATTEPSKPEASQDKQVPLQALHAEREARKALERKLADLEQRVSQPPPPAEPEDVPPDPEVDPIGALKYNQRKFTEFQQQQQNQVLQQQLLSTYQASMHSYMVTEPAFKDAYEHALKSRGAELTAYGMSEQEIDATLKQEQLQIAATAIRQGKNPAELIYKFAEARGFQKKPAVVPAATAPAPAAPVIPVIDPAIQKAKADAATSLTSGGKPPANDLTEDEALRTLKGAALNSWMDKKWKEMEQTSGRKSSLFPN